LYFAKIAVYVKADNIVSPLAQTAILTNKLLVLSISDIYLKAWNADLRGFNGFPRIFSGVFLNPCSLVRRTVL